MRTMPNTTKSLVIAFALITLLSFSLLAVGADWAGSASSDASIEIAAGSATPMYVKFEGVDGEAQDKDHKDWSDLLAFSQSHMSLGVGPARIGGAAGIAFDKIVLSKAIDKASPKLAEAVCKGTVYGKVQIEVTYPFAEGNKPLYACELRNAILTSYHVSGSGQSETLPPEEISVEFSEIKVTYTEYDAMGRAKGSIEYSWRVDEGGSFSR